MCLYHAARKMLEKSTPVVNFINILHTNFVVQTLFRQLFSNYMYVEKAGKTTFVDKVVRKMLMKLTADL